MPIPAHLFFIAGREMMWLTNCHRMGKLERESCANYTTLARSR